jgi:hypothetical protein
MTSLGSRRGAANLGLPLMLATFVLIAGFMYWLSVTAEPTQPAVEEVVEDEPTQTVRGTLVPVDDLKVATITSYEGQLIRVEDVILSSSMGDQTFFVDLPETDNLPAQPFLIRLGADSTGAVGEVPEMGSFITVVGMLTPMSDSIVSDWLASGSISENDQLLVEFATHFVEVDEWEAGSAPEAASPAGEGAPAGA